MLAGTLQKCRTNPNEPQPIDVIPAPPDFLSTRAAEIFREHAAIVAQMGVVSLGDGTALALLASRLEEVERMTAVIEDLGHVQTTRTKDGQTVIRARPETAMRSEAMRHAQSLLAEFGLTPAARSKVSARAPEEANPFAAI